MASQLTEEQVTEFKEAFEEIDVDGKGTITMKELLDKLPEEFDKFDMNSHIYVMVAMADTNGDGMINFEEFLEMMVKG